MRRIGQWLMALGAAVGVGVALAMFAHLGFAGVPWLVNVALAKLSLLGAEGLMGAGAASIRIANRHEQKLLGRDGP